MHGGGDVSWIRVENLKNEIINTRRSRLFGGLNVVDLVMGDFW